jgi:hypothetical protein
MPITCPDIEPAPIAAYQDLSSDDLRLLRIDYQIDRARRKSAETRRFCDDRIATIDRLLTERGTPTR